MGRHTKNEGKFSILSFALFSKSRDPEEGDWSYENGIITRGVLRKKSINLTSQLKEIHELSGTFRTLVIDAGSSGSYWKGAIFSGGNVIAGMLTQHSKERKLGASAVFRIILKNGKDFNVSTDQSILKELVELSGVEISPSKTIKNKVTINDTAPTNKDDSKFFLQATQEVEDNNQNSAIWAKAMALCEGDKNKAKYEYINLRAQNLIPEEATANKK